MENNENDWININELEKEISILNKKYRVKIVWYQIQNIVQNKYELDELDDINCILILNYDENMNICVKKYETKY